MDALLLLGAMCGLAAALKGSRTAFLLLADSAFGELLMAAGVPFNPWLWMAMNLCAVVLPVGLRRSMSNSDVLIIALYVAIWPLYSVDTNLACDIIAGATALQFLLSWQLPAINGVPSTKPTRGPDYPWNMRVAYA